MKVGKGKVVTMSYLLTNSQGEELDRSETGQPLMYMHGYGQLVPGLESNLEGLEKGDKPQKIRVEPGEAYGEVRDDLILTVRREQFPKDVEIKSGMQFWAQSPEGEQHPFLVTAVGIEEVEVDGNHPLAGETLFFDIEIHDVREATEEELAHGHAHGPGGHQH